MCEISDEMLMAYADGELAEDLRVRVEAYLADDPNGAQRLAASRATGRNLAAIFGRPMREPVPQHLIDLVREFPSDRARTTQTAEAKVTTFDKRRRMATVPTRPWAIAASFAALLATGAGSLWFFNRTPNNADSAYGLATSLDGKRIAGEALASALETAASGSATARTISGEAASVKPSFTFLTGKGEYCRQYEIVGAKTSGFSGVACREAGGTWRIETQISFAARSSTEGTIVPAGKESPASVDAAVDRLISGDVLGVEDEARAMRSGWQGVRP